MAALFLCPTFYAFACIQQKSKNTKQLSSLLPKNIDGVEQRTAKRWMLSVIANASATGR